MHAFIIILAVAGFLLYAIGAMMRDTFAMASGAMCMASAAFGERDIHD